MIVVTSTDKRSNWAKKISDQWRGSVESIVKVGALLSQAKTDMGAAEYYAMVKEDLPFGDRSAQMLIDIAEDPRIANHGSQLPASWRTLYEIHTLPDPIFKKAIKDGTLNPDTERKEVLQLKQSLVPPPPRRPVETRPEPREAVFTETPRPSGASAPAEMPSSPPRDALDTTEQVFAEIVRSLASVDMVEVAKASNPDASTKIAMHIERIRAELDVVENALAHQNIRAGERAGAIQ